MRYSVPQLMAFAAVSIALTTGTLLGSRFLLEPALSWLSLEEAARWIHAFLFERSVVQWCTLSVFFFAFTVVASRVIHHVSVSRAVRTVAPLDLSRQHAPVGVADQVCDRIDGVRNCLAEHGRSAAVQRARELSRHDEDSMEQVYALLGSTVQVMLALGFFGTVWGISRSMFGSFGQLSGAAPEGIAEGLRQFSEALSTALDTTVLALVCGILASVVITIARWAETGGLAGLEQLVREKFDLVPESQTDSSGHLTRQLATVVAEGAGLLREVAGETAQVLRNELTRIADTELDHFRREYGATHNQAASEFSQLAQDAVQEFGHQARAASAGMAATRHQFEQDVQRAQEVFDTGVAEAVKQVEQSGGALRKDMEDGFEKVEQSLQRVPEISIRYPQTAKGQDVRVQGSAPPAGQEEAADNDDLSEDSGVDKHDIDGVSTE